MAMHTRGHWRVVTLSFICLLVASCVSFTGYKLTHVDRGIKFSHATHAEDLTCTDCHNLDDPEAIIPNHDICSVCHDFDPDAPSEETCSPCHTKSDYSVEPRKSLLGEERIFKHAPHIEAEMECSACHGDVDKRPLKATSLKPFCMDCHAQKDAKLTECSVCHKELNKNVVPQYRYAVRIPHDSPQIWKRVHGQQAKLDENYCALCHDAPVMCDTCHQSEAPESHTVTWRRSTHGFHATMDRNKCAVCHEEDSCHKCHENTRPRSHRAGWSGTQERHCTSCHFPAERTNCTVCHESIEHTAANPSIHALGVFPANCATCHPGGNPFRAPHPLNSTVGCKSCHQ